MKDMRQHHNVEHMDGMKTQYVYPEQLCKIQRFHSHNNIQPTKIVPIYRDSYSASNVASPKQIHWLLG